MGGFVWHELTTADPEGAAAFYGRLLGWEAETFPGSAPPYLVLKAAGVGVAGLCGIKAPQPAGWIGYLHVADVEEACRRAEAAGGTAVAPAEEMEGIGRMQLMHDPDGVPFVLMTPAPREAPPRPPEGTTGLSVWDEHYGADVERSFAFYAGLAGWTKDSAMDMGEMGTYQMVAVGGRAIAGLMRAPEAMGPRWLAYFNVPSVTGAMEEAERLGGRPFFGPQEVPGAMWIAQILDPQGHPFGIVGPKG